MPENQEVQKPRFYICPICFEAGDEQHECHGQLMIPCNAKNAADCRPLMTKNGRLTSRAPKWFLNETGPKRSQD